MPDNRRFWTGALCGAAAAYLADRLWKHRKMQPRLSVMDGGAKILQIPLKRDQSAGDPSALVSERGHAMPDFERRGGAPGGAVSAEVHEVPGHPGQRLDHSNAAQTVRSASRTQMHPPARDSKG